MTTSQDAESVRVERTPEQRARIKASTAAWLVRRKALTAERRARRVLP